MITAMVLINADVQALDHLGNEIASLDSVAEVYSITGDYDFIAIIRVKDYEAISEAVTKKIAQLDGVTKTHTMMAFQCFSRYDMESMWSIGLD